MKLHYSTILTVTLVNFDCTCALNCEAGKSGSQVIIKEAKFNTPLIQSTNIFLERRSPRTVKGEAIPKEELMVSFETARWASGEKGSS